MLRKLFIFAFILILLAGVGLGVYFLRPSKRYAQHYTKGLIYFDKNKYSEAIVEFNAAKKIYSKNKTLLLYLAESYRRNMQNSESIAILNKTISEYPNDEKAHRRLIRSYEVNKQHLKALAACDNYIKIVKNDVYIRNLRGLVLVSLKQTNQAKEEFMLAIKLNKSYSDAYKNLAKVYWKEKDIDSAVNTLKEFLITKPDHFEVRNLLGDYYRSSGQLIKATKEFTYLYEKYPAKILVTSAKLSIVLLLSQQMDKLQQLVDTSFSKNPSKLEVSPFLLYARGALFLEKKQYQEAIADFEFSQQRGLQLASLRYSLALSYDKVNKTVLAIKELNSLIDQEPNYIPAHQILVQFLINENQAEQAVEHCDKYLSRMPDSIELREIKATALMSSGKTQEAQNMYRQLSRLGNNPNIGQRNAILLAISQGKIQEVIERLDQLLEDKQQDPYPLYLLLGRNYLLLKKYDKAIEYANLASKAKPLRISAWQLLAQAHMASQKPEKAISRYLKILKEEPNHRKVPFELANLYYQLKQTKKALNILKKHNKMNSKKPANLELLANILYQDKEYSQAIHYLERIKIKTASQKKLLGDIYRQLEKHEEVE